MPGLGQFLRGQFSVPPVPKVDLTGQAIIITGANSGLGLDAAKLLLSLNCSTLILACRTISKAEGAKKDILQSATSGKASKTTIVTMELELDSFSSVVAFAERCKDLPCIDGILMNAGVALTEFQLAEGYEKTLTVNVISTFLLTTLMVPILRVSATRFNITPVIAVVGSAVHFFADPKELTNPAEGQILTTLSDPKTANLKTRYYLSKLPVMLMVKHLAQILTDSAKQDPTSKPLVIINNVAPGWCKTNLLRDEDGMGVKVALAVVGRSSEHGARTLAHGVSAGKETHGQYVSECVVKPSSAWVRSNEGQKTGAAIWKELTVILERVQPGCTQAL